MASIEKSNRCPICRDRVADGDAFPFCSERCRTIDLGNWLGESYRIPTGERADEDDERTTRPGPS